MYMCVRMCVYMHTHIIILPIYHLTSVFPIAREVARRMTTSKMFEDYPGSESGGVNEEAPANYGGRKPVSYIWEKSLQLGVRP